MAFKTRVRARALFLLFSQLPRHVCRGSLHTHVCAMNAQHTCVRHEALTHMCLELTGVKCVWLHVCGALMAHTCVTASLLSKP